MAVFEIGKGPGGPRSDYTIFAFESVTVSTTSVGFTEATYAPAGAPPASYAFVTIEDNGLSFRCDGTAAETTNHDAGTSDQVIVYGAANIRNFRAIRTGGADAVVRVSFGR